jgi:acetyltransferase AlgX (SGNH hydrolase-like protein)
VIKISEKFFLSLIIATLLVPLPLTLLIHCVNLSPRFDWIANRTLAGVTVKKERPQIDAGSWINGNLQKGINSLISEHFSGRELLIRIYDQILYRLFHKSYMDREEIIEGKNRSLFERDYLADFGHYSPSVPKDEAEALVVMMKDLSMRLKESGSCFVFMITPSKASVYPEEVPDRFLAKLKRGDRRQSNYETLVQLLKKYSIPYVDGREITIKHKQGTPLRAFPKTGTHWTRAVAFFSTQEVLRTIERESGREMAELTESIQSIDQRPDGFDDDLFGLMNLIEKPNERYVHPTFQSPTDWPKRKGVLTFVGGSFVRQINENLEAAEVFERTNYYFYFNLSKTCLPGGITTPVDQSAIPWKEDFWNTAAVVLEANEQAIDSQHLRTFLMAALSAIEQKSAPPKRTDDHPKSFSWAFGTGENGEFLPKNGFALPAHGVTWMGNQGEIEFPWFQQSGGLELMVEVVSSLAEGQSKKVVKVEANGILAGTLALDDPAVHCYSLQLPAAVNQSSSIKLRFSCSPELSVAEGQNLFKMGLARVALVPIRLPILPENDKNHATALIGN